MERGSIVSISEIKRTIDIDLRGTMIMNLCEPRMQQHGRQIEVVRRVSAGSLVVGSFKRGKNMRRRWVENKRTAWLNVRAVTCVFDVHDGVLTHIRLGGNMKQTEAAKMGPWYGGR